MIYKNIIPKRHIWLKSIKIYDGVYRSPLNLFKDSIFAFHRRVTIKEGLRNKAMEDAEKERQEKLSALRQQLEEEKKEFIVYKEQTLRQLQADAEKYNVDISQYVKDLERTPLTEEQIVSEIEAKQKEKEAAKNS